MIVDNPALSLIIAIFLRLYNFFFGNDPLQNAPYGACTTDSDALSWIEGGNVEQTCISHGSNNSDVEMKRCWYKYEPSSVTSLTSTDDNSTSSSSQSIPLVIHLHGAGGCASLPSLNLGSLAEKEQFVLIWPQGTFNVLDGPGPFFDFMPSLNISSWNDGTGLFGAQQAEVDDVDFLNTMIDTVLSEDEEEGSSLLDPDRVYLSGHYNGATMAQRFILQSSQRKVAGVMTFAGAGAPNDSLWSPGSTSSEAYEATPIIHVSGTVDGIVPFHERRGPLAGALQSLEAWADLNSCTNYELQKEGETPLYYVRHSYDDCESPVQLLEIPGAGHHPFIKGAGEFEISPVNTIAICPFRTGSFANEKDCTLIELDTTQLAWDYISQFSLSSSS